jgi:hypothetical protein
MLIWWCWAAEAYMAGKGAEGGTGSVTCCHWFAALFAQTCKQWGLGFCLMSQLWQILQGHLLADGIYAHVTRLKQVTK